MKKVPLRRCLGCFESKPKNELIRVVKSKNEEITLDKTGKKQGRGAYICYNKDCLEKVIKTKKLDKEFDTTISNDIYENLRRDFDSDN